LATNRTRDTLTFDSVSPSLRAISTCLDASKLALTCTEQAKIDTNHADLKLFRNPPAASNVLRDDEAAEPDVRAVRQLEDLFFGAELREADDGSKCFFAVDEKAFRGMGRRRRRGRRQGQDGWLDEVALAVFIGTAAQNDRGAVGFRVCSLEDHQHLFFKQGMKQ
jgi:hypothetical protein